MTPRPELPVDIRVELHDGRTFTYPGTSVAADVVEDLRQHGVQPGDIRRTVHVIRRGSLTIAGAATRTPTDGDA